MSSDKLALSVINFNFCNNLSFNDKQTRCRIRIDGSRCHFMVIDTQAAENGHQFGVFCHSKREWIFSGLGVDDNEMTTASVYPNPTTGLFIIEGQDITEVEVYNAQGQLIRTQMISGNGTEIDLSNAASGLYLVRIMNGAGVTERTVVKR